MLKFIDNINKYNIYTNEELKKFIIQLEKRYKFSNEIETFKNLVNFSQNSKVPYHSWFKYREGYSHNLVKELIFREKLSSKNFIIDPFCGSGTTLVEASLNGFSSLGMDINPMSSFISNAKSSFYTNEDIISIKKHLINLKKYNINIVNEENYEDVKRYFNQKNFKELLIIKNFIDSISQEKVKKIFMTGFLSIIEDVSDRKRDGNGLKKSLSKVTDVHQYFIKKMMDIYNDLINTQINVYESGKAIAESSMNLFENVEKFAKIKKLSPGAIIFSPPYPNSFDYFESYKMELRLGDFVSNSEDIKLLRNQAVRSFISNSQTSIVEDKFINLMSNEIEEAIPIKEAITGKRDNRTRKVPKMLKGYFNDMERILYQCNISLTTGCKTYVVIDQSSYLGKIVPTDLLLGYLGEKVGFKVNEIIICRKAKTSGQQIQRFPYLAESLRESILILEKI